MAANKRHRSRAERDFIKGKSKRLKVTVEADRSKPSLGFSPVQVTASGAGHHGKFKRSRSRADRQSSKRALRAGDYC